jgi:hypothetical protein
METLCRAMSPYLPLELVIFIHQYLVEDSDSDHQRIHKDLCSASLVHSSRLHTTRSMLFQRLKVGVHDWRREPSWENKTDKLADVLEHMEDRPDLANHVLANIFGSLKLKHLSWRWSAASIQSQKANLAPTSIFLETHGENTVT